MRKALGILNKNRYKLLKSLTDLIHLHKLFVFDEKFFFIVRWHEHGDLATRS